MEIDSYAQISGLQHLVYCPRQCSLIHIVGIWNDNHLTTAGKIAHQRTDSGENESRKKVKIYRSLLLISHKYEIRGVSDIVEVSGSKQNKTIFPIEYKHGPRKNSLADDVQLMAQALCLEEMMNIKINEGAVFQVQSKRQRKVFFDADLRNKTIQYIDQYKEMLEKRIIPNGYEKDDIRCPNCSLKDVGACHSNSLNKTILSFLE